MKSKTISDLYSQLSKSCEKYYVLVIESVSQLNGNYLVKDFVDQANFSPPWGIPTIKSFIWSWGHLK